MSSVLLNTTPGKTPEEGPLGFRGRSPGGGGGVSRKMKVFPPGTCDGRLALMSTSYTLESAE